MKVLITGLAYIPKKQMNNILIHIPHSSKVIPFEYLNDYSDTIELSETVLKLTDTFVDELFYVDGVPQIIFPYSRVFCDVERFLENELMEEKYGHGFYYVNGINLKPFRNDSNKNFIRDYYYKPHHLLVEKTVREMDNPLILDCHSFSNEIYPCTPFNDGEELPHFIIGHNNKEREIQISDFIYNFLIELGFTVNINQLYSGSFMVYDCDSVMIEVNKKLYLKNDFLTKVVDYYKVACIIKNLIHKISMR